jgi:hypothetical protein
MVKDGVLITMGPGGPSKPLRYFFHPSGIFTMPDANDLWASLVADPEANVALGKIPMHVAIATGSM